MKQRLSLLFAVRFPGRSQSLPETMLQIRLQLYSLPGAPAVWQGSAFHLLTLNIRGIALHHGESYQRTLPFPYISLPIMHSLRAAVAKKPEPTQFKRQKSGRSA